MATWAGPPRSYTKGRVRPVQYVVIHSTEGSEGINSAEAGVAYDKVRTDGTSTHLFVDTDTALMEVRYSDTAHAARTHGNACGIQVELCGRAGQSADQWHDAASLPMLRLAAREVAAICREFGLPVRRLSVAEVRAAYYAPAGQRPKGICGHVDVTRAYPEDDGSHTDPGPNFPWSEFLAMVTAAMGGVPAEGGDDMPQMLVRLVDLPAPDNDQIWLAGGGFKHRVTLNQVADVATSAADKLRVLRGEIVATGPISNAECHQAGFLGLLGNGGKVYQSTRDPRYTMDEYYTSWGVDTPAGAAMTEEQLAEVEAAAKAGAAEGAGSGTITLTGTLAPA